MLYKSCVFRVLFSIQKRNMLYLYFMIFFHEIKASEQYLNGQDRFYHNKHISSYSSQKQALKSGISSYSCISGIVKETSFSTIVFIIPVLSFCCFPFQLLTGLWALQFQIYLYFLLQSLHFLVLFLGGFILHNTVFVGIWKKVHNTVFVEIVHLHETDKINKMKI